MVAGIVIAWWQVSFEQRATTPDPAAIADWLSMPALPHFGQATGKDTGHAAPAWPWCSSDDAVRLLRSVLAAGQTAGCVGWDRVTVMFSWRACSAAQTARWLSSDSRGPDLIWLVSPVATAVTKAAMAARSPSP